MYDAPPLHSHGLIPTEIVNQRTMELLTRHYQAANRLTPDNFKKAMAGKFDEAERQVCAEAYEMLGRNGFLPSGLDANGQIRWGVILKSDVQLLFEEEPLLENPTKQEAEQLKEMARDQFVTFRDDHVLLDEAA